MRGGIIVRPAEIRRKARKHSPCYFGQIFYGKKHIVVGNYFPYFKIYKLVYRPVHIICANKLCCAQFARGNIRPRQSNATLVFVRRTYKVVLFFVKAVVVYNRASGYHPDYVALDNRALLYRRGVFELFANGNLLAQRNELGNIALGGVKRHSAHRRALFKPAVPARKR